MQSELVVSSELGVNGSQRSVSVSLWLLDTVLVSLLGLVVGGMVLGLGHGSDLLVGHWENMGLMTGQRFNRASDPANKE